MTKPVYYQCGICEQWHSANWNGDCRQDDARFNPEDLDEKHGLCGWIEIDWNLVDAYQAGEIRFVDESWRITPQKGNAS